MNRTWEDKHIAKLHQKMEKNKQLRWFYQWKIAGVRFVYRTGFALVQNTKRLSCCFVVVLFFVVSSSFAYPEQEQKQIYDIVDMQEWNDIQESYEYEAVEVVIPVSEMIDDDDVLEGYDNEELDVKSDDIDQFTLDDILEANELAQGETEEEATDISALSADDWQLVLVNKQHPVPTDYSFTLGTITGNMKCDVRIIDDLMAMLQAAQNDGISLMICSPYRDYNRQTVLFNRKIDYYMNKGYSYTEAYKISSMSVTVPGASEHQIGLALDIVSNTYTTLDSGFGETEAGIWLKEHGCEYGFILRYPLGKEYITGIQYEPWHFRYVGKTAATAIMEQGITLEEFLEDLK